MSLGIYIDHRGGVPLYVQIMEQTRSLIATGVLAPGDQLPTIRELSVELTVNPNTVARAYSELEREGLLATRQGRGTFVLKLKDRTQLSELSSEKLCSIIQEAFVKATTLGYPLAEIKECINNQITIWEQKNDVR